MDRADRLDEVGVGPALMANLNDLLAGPGRLHHGVEVRPIEAHGFLAVEVLPGCDRVEVTPRQWRSHGMALTTASTPSFASSSPCHRWCPPGVSLAGMLDGCEPAFKVLVVDIANCADGHARDLQEILEQDRSAVTDADQADTQRVVRSALRPLKRSRNGRR